MNTFSRSLRMERRGRWFDPKPWHLNLALGLIGCAMLWWARALVEEYDGFQYGFSGVSSAHLALYLGAVFLFLLRPRNVDRWTFPIILTIATVCRLAVLFPEPHLSSDVYRYAWDGQVQHAGINPYRYVPGDPALADLRDPNDDLFQHMNRRDYAHTVYPPVAQIVFFLVTAVNGSVTMMKLAMVLFEGITLLALVRLLRLLGLNREWTLLYAWHPLLIWEIGGSGHLDSLVMAFLTCALLFRYRRQPVLTGLFLGAAVLTKFYPIVVFPALWRRGDWKMPATMTALAAGTYALYLSVGKAVFGFFGGYVDEEGLGNGTRYFLLELAQHIAGAAHATNAVYMVFCAAVLGAVCWWAWRRATPADAAPDAFLAPAFALALATMLLFSPHYPWYVAWLIPLIVLVPTLTGMTYVSGLFFMCTTALAVGSGPKQFHLNEILYSAVGIAFIIEGALRRLPATRGWFLRPTPASPVPVPPRS